MSEGFGMQYLVSLLLGLFVLGPLLAPLTELLELDLAVDTLLVLLVLGSEIVHALARGTG